MFLPTVGKTDPQNERLLVEVIPQEEEEEIELHTLSGPSDSQQPSLHS